MFKTYTSSSSLVITSRWFATSRPGTPVSVRLVYLFNAESVSILWHIWQTCSWFASMDPCTLPWRHNECNGVLNHQPHDCLLSRSFRYSTKKTSKLRVTGIWVRGIHRWPVNSLHKGLVTRKMFPFHDVIMIMTSCMICSLSCATCVLFRQWLAYWLSGTPFTDMI